MGGSGLGSLSGDGSPFIVDWGLVAESGVAPSQVVPALNEGEDGHARLDMGSEAASIEQFAFQRGEEALAHGVVVRVPTEPIEGRTPVSRQRAPKAKEVY